MSVLKRIERWFVVIAQAVYTHKYAVLILTLMLTLIIAMQSFKLKIDTRDEAFFHADDPTMLAYNDFREQFGQDDTFIIALKPDNGLTPDFFKLLYRIHTDLETKVPYLDDITSLVNGRILRAQGDTLMVEDLMAIPPETASESDQMMTLMARYPMFDRLLISPDRSMVTILIRAVAVKPALEDDLMQGFEEGSGSENTALTTYLSNDENMQIYATITQVLNSYQNQGIQFHTAGTPVFVAEITQGIMDDLGVMVPLSIILIILFLTILFRRISGVLFPLIVVVFSLLSTLGIMALSGVAVSTIIQILPTFLIVVGIADSVHILTLFYQKLNLGNHKREAIIHAIEKAGLPVFMTSITTACGLYSFTWADVASVAQLGYMAPMGVMLAFLYTIILLPALIAIFPAKMAKHENSDKPPLMDTIFAGITHLTVRHPMLITLIATTITTASAISATTVKFSHNAMTWFPKGTPVRESTEIIDRVNGGSVMLEITIDSGRENGLQQPDRLNRMDQATQHIPSIQAHHIRAAKAWSIVDVLKEINRALNQDRDQAYVLPQTKELVAQELILFESSGSDDLEDVTDSQYRIGRISLLAPFTDSVLYKDYADKIEQYLSELFPSESVTLTGHMSLFIQITKNFIASMAKSYVIALVLITLLMFLMLGSIRTGAMSIVANITPILMVFGLMGVLSIPLDMGTILIGSIVLGLVVDDTIHFLHHFRRAFSESGDVEAAILETMFSTGRALLITSAVLCGGFFIYTLSFLSTNVRFGLLTGCAVIFALIADFFLVPALLVLVYGRNPEKHH
jgi:predicted RND superfamily exporter protein